MTSPFTELQYEFPDDVSALCNEIMRGKTNNFLFTRREETVTRNSAKKLIQGRILEDLKQVGRELAEEKAIKKAEKLKEEKAKAKAAAEGVKYEQPKRKPRRHERSEHTSRVFITIGESRISVPVALVRLRKPPQGYKQPLDEWLRLARFVQEALHNVEVSYHSDSKINASFTRRLQVCYKSIEAWIINMNAYEGSADDETDVDLRRSISTSKDGKYEPVLDENGEPVLDENGDPIMKLIPYGKRVMDDKSDLVEENQRHEAQAVNDARTGDLRKEKSKKTSMLKACVEIAEKRWEHKRLLEAS